MKKILIIGKRGFIGNNLSKYLKKKFIVNYKSFKNIDKIKSKIDDFDFIINTSIDKSYIKKRYNHKFDNDLKISNFINNNKTVYIFLSTRKVYKAKANIRENSKILPKSNYEKNKFITENKLKEILNKNLIILRISNVIGDKSNIRKLHNTFIDIFFNNIKKGFMLDNKNDYKDFISIDKFCEIVKKIIQRDLRGIFNVSIGEKILINDILNWLNYYNLKKVRRKDNKNKVDCFYLNNNKLMSKIKINNSVLELKRYCLKVSKKMFS
jgi:nucleoside-diphosphate-sugar epimerase